MCANRVGILSGFAAIACCCMMAVPGRFVVLVC